MGARQEIVDWAIAAGLAGASWAELTSGYCDRLVAAGVPLWRVAIGADALHPLIDAQGLRWVSGEGVREEHFFREGAPEQQESWLRSPWYRLLESGQTGLRCRLGEGEGRDAFPLLADLATRGATDYVAHIVRFGDDEAGMVRGLATSWTTRADRGFEDDHLALIASTLPTLTLAFKAAIALAAARTLVTTYLGEDAATRVLRGEIERGRVQTVRKVLWLSDLTGFTRIADTLPRDALLELLNAYADTLVGVVRDHGGQVLKFIGDGMLAVFTGEADEASRRALDAALAARAAVDALERERRAADLQVTGFTLALHEGEVLYGNVGSRDRLDFTVIGPAVNECSRIQAMSRSLEQPVLVSSAFAAACGDQRRRLVSVGRYALRGVGRPQELFTLDPEAHEPGGR